MICFAASLADTATTISYPALTSHRAMPEAQRQRLGITDGLLRLSVGIEAIDDIRADLAGGLAAI
jgi:cystathionine gamma-synthase